MANSTRKCKQCAEYKPAESGVKVPAGWFCCHAHTIDFAREKAAKAKARHLANTKATEMEAERAKAASYRKRKLEVNRAQHLDRLQNLVNQWVLHVRDANEPCCTCGTSNPGIKYDAGHFLSRGASPELRFEVTNIHRQCSVQCNGHKSGAKAEYIEFIIKKYGHAHYDWLCGPHRKLKDQLPDSDVIELEIAKYRKIIRDSGLKPRA